MILETLCLLGGAMVGSSLGGHKTVHNHYLEPKEDHKKLQPIQLNEEMSPPTWIREVCVMALDKEMARKLILRDYDPIKMRVLVSGPKWIINQMLGIW